jgi:hypothetical protein
MGQAKQRGNYDERKAMASQKKERQQAAYHEIAIRKESPKLTQTKLIASALLAAFDLN